MKKIFIALLLSISTTVFCQTPGELLQAKLNGIRAMTANFKQSVKAKHRVVSRSSGTMALQRPGRFRWQTAQPMAQLMVADGQRIWVYDKDLEQVTVKKQSKGLGGTAALFLSGYDDTVTRDFNVSQTGVGDELVFDLKSKSSKASFQRIKLNFRQDLLTGLELYDQLGQVTTVQLSQIKLNPKLASNMFQFKTPKGVDVVQQ
ncbi:outer membrane lipoprotein chaperone LolA [Legionella longbeachae]|uniref:Outer-membrane lipoprotein carrier protein n=1 Tax=Legionella longbeachae serogroup 1 (strain NSW150) TaxID=661367 RepID=D3HJY0_LEGLN|nr:outer membrane lipoprotein chaperone LolA [Legionella longbeachae]VEE03260.1 Outer-membrane lipoprotein carrier protein precursor [Legionella oakridgensis]HBD7398568.1 outer membrane lipoprotein chaperone LolA [Legionella pneumophila]ARB93842.1 outer membrane lipoprotein carrier protein LolA [Legionella longbeachae]ARM33018.1 outer membrane lipoprotein chaperone LolA [Legionella longbeachae]EEZ94150.1 outer membrane lipoprotein carrier protein LolA [Legionella longbeachae D-4968]